MSKDPDSFAHLQSHMSERDYKILQDMAKHAQNMSAKKKKEQAEIIQNIKTNIWPNLHTIPNLNQYLTTLDLNVYDILREYKDEKSGHGLLHLSVIRRDVAAFTNLTHRGINQQAQDNNDLTPIQYATEQVPEFFAALLANKQNGINFKITNEEGKNALHHAIKIGRFENASLLCNSKDDRLPDINAQDKDGDTALSLLLKNTYTEAKNPEIERLMKHMLANGADPFIKGKDGISPFEVAVQKGLIKDPLEYFINLPISSESQQAHILEQVDRLKDHYEVISDFYTKVCDIEFLKKAISGPNADIALVLIDKYFPRDGSNDTKHKRTEIFEHAQKNGKSEKELEDLAQAFGGKLVLKSRVKAPSSASDISSKKSPSPRVTRKRSPSENSDSTVTTASSTNSEESRSSRRSEVKLSTSTQFAAKLVEHYGTTFDQGVLDKMRKYAMTKDGILEHTAADTGRYEQGKARKSATKHLAKLLEPLRLTDNEMIKQLSEEYQKFKKDSKHKINFPERWGSQKKKIQTQEH